jgi:TatD DNase family protein
MLVFRKLCSMTTTRQLIDTHTHLAMVDYSHCLKEVLSRSRMAGVDRWITIGTNRNDSLRSLELSRAHEGLFCTVGVHPHEAGQAENGVLEEYRQWTQAESVCAIGEIGLDYHYNFSERPRQRQVFTEQLELAADLNMPVVIHCREAMDDCLDILKEWNQADARVVFHCFGGDKKEAARLLDRGYYLSYTGILTFRNAAAIVESAKYAPLNKIMLETDCPYLSPEPKRNQRPNEPALLVHIATKLAELRNSNLTEVAEQTTQNAVEFFSIK